jgi:hypothetical protein
MFRKVYAEGGGGARGVVQADGGIRMPGGRVVYRGG